MKKPHPVGEGTVSPSTPQNSPTDTPVDSGVVPGSGEREGGAPEKAVHPPSDSTYILLCLGCWLLLLTTIGRTDFEVTLGYYLADFLSRLVVWTVVLGAIAVVVSRLRARRHWLTVFAWLFLGASVFDASTVIFETLVVIPKVKEVIRNNPSVFSPYSPVQPRVQAAIAKPATEQSYTNMEHRFSIRFPQGWLVSEDMTAPNMIVKAFQTDKETQVLAMITIEAWPGMAQQHYTGEQFFQEFKTKFPLCDVQLLDSGTQTIEGKSVAWNKINTLCPMLPLPYGSLTSFLYYFVQGNQTYTVTGVTPMKPGLFASYEDTMRTSIASMDFF